RPSKENYTNHLSLSFTEQRTQIPPLKREKEERETARNGERQLFGACDGGGSRRWCNWWRCAVYGTYEAVRYKVPGLMKIRYIGQTTLGSAAIFGLFLGAGSLIHCGKSY
ncbi:hypothetical protein AABB24_019640, partial [Solanum stoloniferum]